MKNKANSSKEIEFKLICLCLSLYHAHTWRTLLKWFTRSKDLALKANRTHTWQLANSDCQTKSHVSADEQRGLATWPVRLGFSNCCELGLTTYSCFDNGLQLPPIHLAISDGVLFKCLENASANLHNRKRQRRTKLQYVTFPNFHVALREYIIQT